MGERRGARAREIERAPKARSIGGTNGRARARARVCVRGKERARECV